MLNSLIPLTTRRFTSTVKRCCGMKPQASGFCRLSTDIKSVKDSGTKILYDGECSLCLAEISILRRLPSQKKLEFIDISSDSYKPELYGGVTYEDAMKEMHVIVDGKVYVKAEAIRKMYDEVGLTWLANMTRWPRLAPFCDELYVKFARYRLERALKNCDTGSCSVKLKALKENSSRQSESEKKY